MPKFGVIITAAGQSTRFGGNEKKQFEELAGRAVFIRAMEPFLAREDVAVVVAAVAAEDLERVKLRWGNHLGFHGVKLTAGGSERVDSVAAAMELIPSECDHVAIHDAARPLIDPELIDKVFHEAVATGAAIPALPCPATLKHVEDVPQTPADAGWGIVHRIIAATVPRESLWLAQTPQAFRRSIYAEALARRAQIQGPITDDAQLVEAIGHPVAVIMGLPDNFKITTAADLAMAKQICKSRGMSGPAEPGRHHRF